MRIEMKLYNLHSLDVTKTYDAIDI